MRAASFGTLLDLVSDGPPLGAVGLGVRRAIDPPDQPLIRLTLGAGGGDEGRDRAGPESDPGGVFWPGLRPPLPAWAMALRWMRRRIRKHSGGLFSRRRRQRCQVALRPFETAGLMPSWASLMTGFTPRADPAASACEGTRSRSARPRKCLFPNPEPRAARRCSPPRWRG